MERSDRLVKQVREIFCSINVSKALQSNLTHHILPFTRIQSPIFLDVTCPNTLYDVLIPIHKTPSAGGTFSAKSGGKVGQAFEPDGKVGGKVQEASDETWDKGKDVKANS
jgi:hypothetical protein